MESAPPLLLYFISPLQSSNTLVLTQYLKTILERSSLDRKFLVVDGRILYPEITVAQYTRLRHKVLVHFTQQSPSEELLRLVEHVPDISPEFDQDMLWDNEDYIKKANESHADALDIWVINQDGDEETQPKFLTQKNACCILRVSGVQGGSRFGFLLLINESSDIRKFTKILDLEDESSEEIDKKRDHVLVQIKSNVTQYVYQFYVQSKLSSFELWHELLNEIKFKKAIDPTTLQKIDVTENNSEIKFYLSLDKNNSRKALLDRENINDRPLQHAGDGPFVVWIEGLVMKQLERTVDLSNYSEMDKVEIYENQMRIAEHIYRRICHIFDGEAKFLQKFCNFEFRILVPRFLTLRDQTWARVTGTGVVDSQESKDKYIKMFPSTDKSDIEEFCNRVVENPTTLFMIINDECHWAIMKDSAVDKTLNDERILKAPNVLILMVSATPYSVITKKSRLPELYWLKEDIPGVGAKGDCKDLSGKSEKEIQSIEASLEEVHIMRWFDPHREDYEFFNRTEYCRISQLIETLIDGNQKQVEIEKKRIRWDESLAGMMSDFLNDEFLSEILSTIITLQWIVFFHLQKRGSFSNNKIERNLAEFLKLTAETVLARLDFLTKPQANLFSATVEHIQENMSHFIQLALKDGQEYLSRYPDSVVSIICCSNSSKSACLILIDLWVALEPDLKQRIKLLVSNNQEEFWVYDQNFPSAQHPDRSRLFSNFVRRIMDFLQTKVVKSTDSKANAELEFTMLTMDYVFSLLSYAHFRLAPRAENATSNFSGRKLCSFQKTMENLTSDRVQKFSENFIRILSDDEFANNDGGKLARFYLKQMMFRASDVQDEISNNDLFTSVLIQFLKLKFNIEECIRNPPDNPGESEVYSLRNEMVLPIFTETDRVIQDLLNVDEDGCGRMKVLRFATTKFGQQFQRIMSQVHRDATLNLFDTFCMVSDYGEATILDTMYPQSPFFLKMSRDKNGIRRCLADVLSFRQQQQQGGQYLLYSDLVHIPCLLVLVGKGRMGDSFPSTFNCLDLRLCSSTNGTSFIQELGRLCRYGESESAIAPYALIKTNDVFKGNNTTRSASTASCIRGAVEKSLKEAIPNPFKHLIMSSLDRQYSGSSRTPAVSDPPYILRRHLYPNKKNYDSSNESFHQHRLLLFAECQVGKTGVYLYLLKHLKSLFSGQTIDSEIDHIQLPIQEFASPLLKFQYPYWEMNHAITSYRQLGNGKYDVRIMKERFAALISALRNSSCNPLENYYHDRKMKERPLSKPALDCFQHLSNLVTSNSDCCGVRLEGDSYVVFDPERLHQLLWFDREKDDFKRIRIAQSDKVENVQNSRVIDVWKTSGLSETHSVQRMPENGLPFRANKIFACFPRIRAQRSILNVRVSGFASEYCVRLSIPDKMSRLFVKDPCIVSQLRVDWDTSRIECLKYWIFIPTYNRVNSARLDYSSCMTMGADGNQKKQCGVDYMRILVVRPGEQFTSYSKVYGDSDVILELPDFYTETYDNQEFKFDPETGGIGYARRCIQEFCRTLKMKFAWMLDDNISSCFKLKTQLVNQVAGTHVLATNWEHCSFWEVMLALETVLDDSSPTTTLEGQSFSIYHEARSSNIVSSKGSWTATTGDLTDGSSTFGVLGTRRDFRKWISGVNDHHSIHALTQSVYSMVLINMEATFDKGIRYPIKQFGEDIEFNYLCLENGLKVLKTNKFLHHKPNYHPQTRELSVKMLSNEYQGFHHVPYSFCKGICAVFDSPEKLPLENLQMLLEYLKSSTDLKVDEGSYVVPSPFEVQSDHTAEFTKESPSIKGTSWILSFKHFFQTHCAKASLITTPEAIWEASQFENNMLRVVDHWLRICGLHQVDISALSTNQSQLVLGFFEMSCTDFFKGIEKVVSRLKSQSVKLDEFRILTFPHLLAGSTTAAAFNVLQFSEDIIPVCKEIMSSQSIRITVHSSSSPSLLRDSDGLVQDDGIIKIHIPPPESWPTSMFLFSVLVDDEDSESESSETIYFEQLPSPETVNTPTIKKRQKKSFLKILEDVKDKNTSEQWKVIGNMFEDDPQVFWECTEHDLLYSNNLLNLNAIKESDGLLVKYFRVAFAIAQSIRIEDINSDIDRSSSTGGLASQKSIKLVRHSLRKSQLIVFDLVKDSSPLDLKLVMSLMNISPEAKKKPKHNFLSIQMRLIYSLFDNYMSLKRILKKVDGQNRMLTADKESKFSKVDYAQEIEKICFTSNAPGLNHEESVSKNTKSSKKRPRQEYSPLLSPRASRMPRLEDMDVISLD